MSYEEERIYKSRKALEYAAMGFNAERDRVAVRLAECSLEETKDLLTSLLLDFEVYEDAKKDLENVIEKYGKEVEA